MDRVCRNDSTFKKTIYLFSAISAKNLDLLSESIEYCTRGLEVFPTYLDLLSYRAKVYELRGDFEQAHKDYEKILSARKNNVETLLKNADVLKKIGAYTNSLSNLSNAFYADQKGEFKQ